MDRSEIIGKWSFNTAFEEDISNDKQLQFYENGTGSVVVGAEVALSYEWAIAEDGNDILIGNNTTPEGEPCGKRGLMISGATLSTEVFPKGEFKILSFTKFSLPFGIRKFVKL
jgi:hypothetical protein